MPTRPSRKSRNKNKTGDDESDDMLRLAASRWTKAIAQARDAAARGVDLAEVARPPPPPPPPPAPVAAAPAAPAAPVALSTAATGGAESFWLAASPTTTTLLGRLSDVQSKGSTPGKKAPTPAKAKPATPAKPAPTPPKPAPAKPPAKSPPKPKTTKPQLAGNPLLVLCDMNGTLVHRSKAPLPVSAKAAVVENGTHYYARDHAEDLVQFLCDAATPSDPARRRVVFAFYTSMREANAQPIARYLTKGKRADMYERKFNKDDASGENSWDTMRDLPKVWGTPAKAAHGFDETNTLVIDDTHRKMREYPSNVLVVPTYDEATVRKGGDDALEYLAAYIDALLDHPDDIRTAVDDRPFVAPSF